MRTDSEETIICTGFRTRFRGEPYWRPKRDTCSQTSEYREKYRDERVQVQVEGWYIAPVHSHKNVFDLSSAKELDKNLSQPPFPCCVECSLPLHLFRYLYDQTIYSGVEEILFFSRKIDLDVSRRAIAEVKRYCNTCNSIDLAPMHWKRFQKKVHRTIKKILARSK